MAEQLKDFYNTKVVPKMMEQFEYKNVHQVPKVLKVTVNRGLGEASQNAKALEASVAEVGVITGQRPVITRAKKAIGSEEHTSELQSLTNLVCRLLLEKKNKRTKKKKHTKAPSLRKTLSYKQTPCDVFNKSDIHI